MFNHSAVNIAGRIAVQIPAGQQSQPLTPGVYDVWGNAPAYVKIGIVANDVTGNTGYFVPSGQIISLRVAKDGERIGSTAAISYMKVD